MLVKLTEVVNNGAVTTGVKYTLREVMINPEHVNMIREDHRMSVLNEQGAIADGLSDEHTFSKLTINRGHSGSDIIVIGSPAIVEKQLNKTLALLRG